MKFQIKTRNMILVAMFTALIAVGAFIKIPIGAVPISLQGFFVNLAGMLLGAKLGALSALVYLILGLIGIPIFTSGSGIGYIFNPSFGFLISFIFGAASTGYFSHKLKKVSFIKLLGVCYISNIIIYSIGVPYFYFIMNSYLGKNITITQTLISCVAVFIPGDFLKMCFASFIGSKTIPILRKAGYMKGDVSTHAAT